VSLEPSDECLSRLLAKLSTLQIDGIDSEEIARSQRELWATNGELRRLRETQVRLEDISAALLRIATLDFATPLAILMDGTATDATCGAINMLAEELQFQLAERDRTEQELEERVRKRTVELKKNLEHLAVYRILFQMAGTLALVMDLDGTIRLASPGWKQITGQAGESLIGQSVASFLHPEDPPVDWKHFEENRWIERLHGVESRWRTIAGDYRRLAWQATLDIERQIACAIAHDVTDLRHAQDNAEEARTAAITASRVKSRFLANMSHEIRTPMNGVLGMTMLALDTDLDEPQREYVAAAHSSAQSLLAIINDILDISKIEAGKLELDALPFTLRSEIETALAPLFLRARVKNLGAHLLIDDDVPRNVVGDAVRFRQVLVNLVSNGLKFTENGSVSVRIYRDRKPELLHVVVADTGIGVASKNIETIFEAFRQGDESTSRTFGGTGLGLAICRDLTRLMGGEIWADSAVGKGSEFHFTARLPPTEAPSTGGSAFAEDANKMATRLKVLLAEDNEVNAKVAVRLLERSNCEVVRVASGREAVDAAIAGAFDLILMDVQMPGMDGLEATQEIRRHERISGAHVPIWAVTANAMKGDDRLCTDAGMDGHIAKPIDRALLLRLLSRVRQRCVAPDPAPDDRLRL
jgi:PAS domain S-box-containing protein